MRSLALTGLIAAVLLSGCCRNRNTADYNAAVLSPAPQMTPMLRYIGGDRINVVTVSGNNTDAEHFEPSQRTMQHVAEADIYFVTGTLPYEQALVRSMADGVLSFNLSDTIVPLYGTHTSQLSPDPHIWASLVNLKACAAFVADRLERHVPSEHTGGYTRRATRQIEQLDSLCIHARQALDSAGRPAFGIMHPSLSYFARDFGLRQISVGAEHREMSPRQMCQAVDSLRAANVKILFYDNPGQEQAAKGIAEAAGAQALLLKNNCDNYPAYLLTVARIIARGHE